MSSSHFLSILNEMHTQRQKVHPQVMSDTLAELEVNMQTVLVQS